MHHRGVTEAPQRRSQRLTEGTPAGVTQERHRDAPQRPRDSYYRRNASYALAIAQNRVERVTMTKLGGIGNITEIKSPP